MLVIADQIARRVGGKRRLAGARQAEEECRIPALADVRREIRKGKFPEIFGEPLKTAPRDFPKDWPEIDLIRNKHYFVRNSNFLIRHNF